MSTHPWLFTYFLGGLFFIGLLVSWPLQFIRWVDWIEYRLTGKRMRHNTRTPNPNDFGWVCGALLFGWLPFAAILMLGSLLAHLKERLKIE